MKAIRLTFICHALTQAQKTGSLHCADDGILPLTQKADVLLPGMRVLTAPERRACETAAWLSGQVQIEPALADCDLGRWQGLSLKQLQAEQPQALAEWLHDPASAVHGGESFAALCQRLAAWLAAFDRPGEWLAVTHPMVMRAVLVQLLGCPLTAGQRIDVLPLSRLVLSFTGQWRLRLG
ncbi:histidine phosphatase family protein [Pseudomonas sp. SbB1]|uniref:Phosphoglycerate mutase n=1 Tax=Pseudomonas putida (strain GB-1) TaxID=76869 RepID=B0KJD8_PSEPG|nr:MULTISPECIES: histidine phosphatase family protein [Pseudomonas]MBP0710029.1 histidine phosphatase family protein [Pseudomonas sp. T34]MCK2189476.1 histidine phosphatase family protein [Pseudomonas sp. MB04B]NOG88368.1 histidine phosphatase family protein [Pseudomonas sp. SbB1]NWL07543.1 histidine phosphatase family protein [Pseudomonas hunanensis]ABY97777.1 Phosphoglycerate mutase [Pseudomonas putida GB-1]